MLTDLTSWVPPGRIDVLVLGTGPAGLSIIRALAPTPLKVVALAGGPYQVSDAAQDLYRCEIVGLGHGGSHGLRFRAHGGSSRRWAGQALPLLDIDFEPREWVPGSGWPIGAADLRRYTSRVEATLGIAPFPEPESRWPHPKGVPLPPFDPGVARMYFSRFSDEPDLARKFDEELVAARNVDVLIDAHAVDVRLDPSGSAVDAVIVRTPERRETVLQAEVVVLCAGGIDNARLLLGSNDRRDGGVGNRHDLVGRYFMDHHGLTWSARSWPDLDRVRDVFAPRRSKTGKHAAFTAVAPARQRRDSILHLASPMVFEPAPNEAIEAARFLKTSWGSASRTELVRQAGRAVRGARSVAPLVWNRYVKNDVAIDRKTAPLIAIGGEQAPNPNSRVTLAAEPDALGMPRVRLDWRMTELDVHSMRTWAAALAEELGRLGLAEVDPDDLDLPDDPDELRGLSDAGHHMGTTRMSADPRTGVVDADCRVHGIDNLYVAGSSVFPTGGFSNPTYTLMLLAERLADHLATRLVPGGCRP